MQRILQVEAREGTMTESPNGRRGEGGLPPHLSLRWGTTLYTLHTIPYIHIYVIMCTVWIYIGEST